ncbi:MAG TPA: hypothetical protein VFQ44_02310 [Streptosporangiaceae bacterium]|nr:hypothetical protein [Streptosporangiaceae bacterium]
MPAITIVIPRSELKPGDKILLTDIYTATAAVSRQVPGCDFIVGYSSGEGQEIRCGDRSRFTVERSDKDESYGPPAESCEAHLGFFIFPLMDGDNTIHAVVTPRWNEKGEG